MSDNPVKQHLNIDSTYRNRSDFPNPTDFVVKCDNSSMAATGFAATDPIIDALPYESDTLQGGSTVTAIVLSATASTINNYYINSILEVAGEFRKITNYVGSTKIATVSPGFSVAPGAVAYNIRRGIPILINTLQAGSTTTTAVLNAGASSITDFYKGAYIRFTSGAALGSIRLILAYDGATKVATLTGAPLSAAPGVATFELLQFSRNNERSINYSGTESKNAVCYVIRLISLIIPNITFSVSQGGTLQQYPDIFVRVISSQAKTYSKPMYTNNPNADNDVLFKVSVEAESYANATNFVVLKSHEMKPIVKWKPDDSLRFTVFMPDGSVMAFSTADNIGNYLPPNPNVQVKALFELTRIDDPYGK